MKFQVFLRENGLFIGIILALVAAFVFLRTKGAKLASLDEFDALLATGQPVLVEFYGNT